MPDPSCMKKLSSIKIFVSVTSEYHKYHHSMGYDFKLSFVPLWAAMLRVCLSMSTDLLKG